ncbi:universal stress protein UspA [Halobacteriales archaeon SW_10_68_16]|jgi:nucleotide-binding universal stress UspA family protein|nr:MAG: universal stress protein UspA [Halobacteriales archaeon SW_10_68_16]
MIERVLIPVDGSEQSERACELVFAEFPEATLVLLHVINPVEAGYSTGAAIPSASEEWYDRQRELANEHLDEIEAAAAEHGIEVDRAIEVGKPIRAIVAYAEEHDVDHIVMGSHGREGVSRVLLGSVAETIVRRSPVPVTVVR